MTALTLLSGVPVASPAEARPRWTSRHAARRLRSAVAAAGLGVVSLLPAPPVWAAPVAVSGGTPGAPVDLTALVLANADIALNGGYFVIRVPPAGAAGVTTPSALKFAHAFVWVDPKTPAVAYGGIMSGNGNVRVTNATSTAMTANRIVNGGALALQQRQAFTNPGGTVFTIDPNTSLDVMAGFTVGQNDFTNNGQLNSDAPYSWGSINGTGCAAFGYDLYPGQDNLSDGKTYSGKVFILYGTHIKATATFDPGLALWQQGISAWETRQNSLITGYTTPNPVISQFPGIYYSAGPDTQIQNGGTLQFTGRAYLITGVGGPDLLAPADSQRLDHGYGFRVEKGRTFYVLGNMIMGNGGPATNADGSSNFFIQGNPYYQNALFKMGQFESPPKSLADVARDQALAFNYSGTYHVNINIDQDVDGNPPHVVRGKADNASGLWANFIVMNPDTMGIGKPANHLVLTQPVFMQGIVQIEKNAILQLGDGTPGNDEARTIVVNGKSYTGGYSTSSGNGMVLTLGNNVLANYPAGYYQISNEGALIVDNVPDAMDLVNAVADVQAWMSGNSLDGIVGHGSVSQIGSLPLTLGAAGGNPNTYSGGTTAAAGTTLVAGSPTAFGSADPALPGSGSVVNRGTLRAAAGVRTINVPGDYTQR